MDEYRLVIRVKNNLLFQLMKKQGIKSQAELARAAGLEPTRVGEVANLRAGAFNADGTLCKAATRLCEFFGCLPEDIYPPEVLAVGLPNNVVERVVGSEEVSRYLLQAQADPVHAIEDQQVTSKIKELFDTLRPREQKLLECRFLQGLTLAETGRMLGITGGRVQQMELHALRKLRKYASVGPEDYGSETPIDMLTKLLESREYLRKKKEEKEAADKERKERMRKAAQWMAKNYGGR